MSILNYLQLQPVDPQDDGTTSALDDYAQDESIDLKHDIDGKTLEDSWDRIVKDIQSDPQPLNFSDK